MKALINLTLSSIIMCASTSMAWAQMDDDLYAPAMTSKERQALKNANAEQNAARRQVRQDIQREGILAERAQRAYYQYEYNEDEPKNESILVDNIDEALARRMDAMNFRPSESSALIEIQEQYAARLQRQFNPDLYNIIIINDKIWVEPKYITSIFANSTDASSGMNDYMKSLKMSSSFNSRSSVKSYYSNDYQYWNKGHYSGMQYPTSYYMGYPSGGWYPYGQWGPSGWGMTWGGNWGFSWGSSWNSPWYNPWFNPWNSPWGNYWGNSWCNPWYNPWHGPHYGPGYNSGWGPIVANRRPVVYGNSINGNNGIIRHNYPQSNRQYSGGGNRGSYDAGFGRGQGSNQPQRPSTPQYQQPTRQNFEPQRPSSPSSTPSMPSGGGSTGGSGYGGGYNDAGGGRRR